MKAGTVGQCEELQGRETRFAVTTLASVTSPFWEKCWRSCRSVMCLGRPLTHSREVAKGWSGSPSAIPAECTKACCLQRRLEFTALRLFFIMAYSNSTRERCSPLLARKCRQSASKVSFASKKRCPPPSSRQVKLTQSFLQIASFARMACATEHDGFRSSGSSGSGITIR